MKGRVRLIACDVKDEPPRRDWFEAVSESDPGRPIQSEIARRDSLTTTETRERAVWRLLIYRPKSQGEMTRVHGSPE